MLATACTSIRHPACAIVPRRGCIHDNFGTVPLLNATSQPPSSNLAAQSPLANRPSYSQHIEASLHRATFLFDCDNELTYDPPVMITVAPNGARKLRKDQPALPISSFELGTTAASSFDVGAGMLHLQARDKNQKHGLDPDLYCLAT